MLKVYGLLIKRQDMETQSFIDYYENHHVPLVLSLAAAPVVYKRNYVVRGEDRADFVKWIENLSDPAIGADEEKFLDGSRTRAAS